jgi:ABC-type nitrate/sulfonate/bicarbonate transport system permease component
MRRFLLGSIVPVLFVGVWEISSRTGLLTLESLSRPSDILVAGIHGVLDG